MKKRMVIIGVVLVGIVLWYGYAWFVDSQRGSSSIPSESERLSILTRLSTASVALLAPEEERRDLLISLEKDSDTVMPSREEKIKILEAFE